MTHGVINPICPLFLGYGIDEMQGLGCSLHRIVSVHTVPSLCAGVTHGNVTGSHLDSRRYSENRLGVDL